jgi:hypothetical protein
VQLIGQRHLPETTEKEVCVKDVISGEKNWVAEKRFRQACVLLTPLSF